LKEKLNDTISSSNTEALPLIQEEVPTLRKSYAEAQEQIQDLTAQNNSLAEEILDLEEQNESVAND